MKTRKGIYLNIDESDYSLPMNDYIFYFSSIKNIERFLRKIKEEKDERNRILNKHMGTQNCDYSDFILFKFYKQVEHRGHRVYYKDVRCKKYLNALILAV